MANETIISIVNPNSESEMLHGVAIVGDILYACHIVDIGTGNGDAIVVAAYDKNTLALASGVTPSRWTISAGMQAIVVSASAVYVNGFRGYTCRIWRFGTSLGDPTHTKGLSATATVLAFQCGVIGKDANGNDVLFSQYSISTVYFGFGITMNSLSDLTSQATDREIWQTTLGASNTYLLFAQFLMQDFVDTHFGANSHPLYVPYGCNSYCGILRVYPELDGSYTNLAADCAIGFEWGDATGVGAFYILGMSADSEDSSLLWAIGAIPRNASNDGETSSEGGDLVLFKIQKYDSSNSNRMKLLKAWRYHNTAGDVFATRAGKIKVTEEYIYLIGGPFPHGGVFYEDDYLESSRAVVLAIRKSSNEGEIHWSRSVGNINGGNGAALSFDIDDTFVYMVGHVPVADMSIKQGYIAKITRPDISGYVAPADNFYLFASNVWERNELSNWATPVVLYEDGGSSNQITVTDPGTLGWGQLTYNTTTYTDDFSNESFTPEIQTASNTSPDIEIAILPNSDYSTALTVTGATYHYDAVDNPTTSTSIHVGTSSSSELIDLFGIDFTSANEHYGKGKILEFKVHAIVYTTNMIYSARSYLKFRDKTGTIRTSALFTTFPATQVPIEQDFTSYITDVHDWDEIAGRHIGVGHYRPVLNYSSRTLRLYATLKYQAYRHSTVAPNGGVKAAGTATVITATVAIISVTIVAIQTECLLPTVVAESAAVESGLLLLIVEAPEPSVSVVRNSIVDIAIIDMVLLFIVPIYDEVMVSDIMYIKSPVQCMVFCVSSITGEVVVMSAALCADVLMSHLTGSADIESAVTDLRKLESPLRE